MMIGDFTDLAQRVERLTIDRRDPERFFLERSEIVDALRRLARESAQMERRRREAAPAAAARRPQSTLQREPTC